MIANYSISNFKVFSESNKLKFAPITLIYGPNSSGKSSIIQSLLVLKKSLLNGQVNTPLKSNNEYFQLGSYTSVVNNHDKTKDINFEINTENSSFKFVYGLIENNNIKSSFLKNVNLKDNKKREYNFECKIDDKNFGFDRFQLKLGENYDEYIIDSFKDTINPFDFLQKQFNSLDARKIKRIFKDIQNETVKKRESKVIPIEILKRINLSKSPVLGDFSDIEQIFKRVMVDIIEKDLSDKEQKLKYILNNISYIGPLRPHPQRVYSLDSLYTDTVGQKGENFLSFLAKDSEYKNSVNKVLKDFGIKYDIDITRTDNEIIGDTLSLILVDRNTNLKTTLVDVGFGIGQVLPILIEGLVKKHSTICIEQPEIHLHPKLQADLANFFAKDVLSDKSNQWIIETHSESLLLRFQRLIKYKELNPEHISIIYVNPTADGAEVIHIPLDEDGDFTVAWPNGFFDERLDEMFGGNPFGEK